MYVLCVLIVATVLLKNSCQAGFGLPATRVNNGMKCHFWAL